MLAAASRPSREGRGLKLNLRTAQLAERITSPLPRGAWIEIILENMVDIGVKSPLPRGAWIEMESNWMIIYARLSPLPRGAWIEIDRSV